MVSTKVPIPDVPAFRASETDQPAEVHVLAVDDSVLDRRVIERLLKTSSYKVTAVDSGRRALEILGIAEALSAPSVNSPNESFSASPDRPYKQPLYMQGFQVHLIITDYCMPGMTGYDLLKKIKGTSELKEIPVVVMSSENVPTRISSCLAEGAEEFLLKPVKLADVKRLRGHIRNSACTASVDVASGGSKRKLPLDEGLLQSPERRVRLNNGVAAT